MIQTFDIQVDTKQKMPTTAVHDSAVKAHDDFSRVFDGCSAKCKSHGASNDATAKDARPTEAQGIGAVADTSGAKQAGPKDAVRKAPDTDCGNDSDAQDRVQNEKPDGGSVAAKEAKDAVKETSGAISAGKKIQVRFPGGVVVLSGVKGLRGVAFDGSNATPSSQATAQSENISGKGPDSAHIADKGDGVTVKQAQPKADNSPAVTPGTADALTASALNVTPVVVNDADAGNIPAASKDGGAENKAPEAVTCAVQKVGDAATPAAGAAGNAIAEAIKEARPKDAKEAGGDNDADDVLPGQATDAAAKDAVKTDAVLRDVSKSTADAVLNDVKEDASPARDAEAAQARQGAAGAGGVETDNAGRSKITSVKDARQTRIDFGASHLEVAGDDIAQADDAGQAPHVAAGSATQRCPDASFGRKDAEGTHKDIDIGMGPAKGIDNATGAVAGAETQFAKDMADAASVQRTTHGGDLYDKMAAGVRMSVSAAGKEVSLQLSPEHLGKLHIKITGGEGDNSVSARITVENASIKSILDADAGRLRDIFNSQGLSLDKYTVDISRGGASFGNFGSLSSGGFAGHERRFGQDGNRTGAPVQINETEQRHVYPAAPYGAGPVKGVDLFA